jgi:hypothetical protein
MSFDVEVAGQIQRTLYERLSELIGRSSIRTTGSTVVLSVIDQSALVAIIARLNDLGVKIEAVRRVPRRGSAG